MAEFASGKYVWIFGDDDKMRPDAVGAVLNTIELGAGAVICNIRVFSKDFQTVIRQHFVKARNDITFLEADQVMCWLGAYPGYISCVILRRHDFLKVPSSDYMSFYQDRASFLYAAYCVFRNCGPVVFLAHSIVLNRGDMPEANLADAREGGIGVKTSDDVADTCWNRFFIEGFSRALQELGVKGYSGHAVRKAKTRIIFDYILPRLLMVKNRGYGAKLLTSQSMKYLKASWALWLLVLPLAPLPATVLRSIRNIKHKLT